MVFTLTKQRTIEDITSKLFGVLLMKSFYKIVKCKGCSYITSMQMSATTVVTYHDGKY